MSLRLQASVPNGFELRVSDGKQSATKGLIECTLSSLPLYLYVYGTRANDSGQWCQSLIGTARVTYPKAGQVSIRDVNGNEQTKVKILRVTEYGKIAKKPPIPVKALGLLKPNSLAGHRAYSQIAQRYRRPVIRHPFFDKMPVWILAQPPPLRGASKTGERYWLHVLDYALRMLHVPYSQFLRDAYRPSASVKVREVLAQVIGFRSWNCPYLFDRSQRRGREVGIDQFDWLRDTPNVHIAAGDCEDSARDIMLTYSELVRFEKPKHPGVAALVFLSRMYCFCVVDSSIRRGNSIIGTDPKHDRLSSVTLHMYAQLLPWSVVYSKLGNSGLRAQIRAWLESTRKVDVVKHTANWGIMSLESTSPCYGHWLNPFAEKKEEVYSRDQWKIRKRLLGAALPRAQIHAVDILFSTMGFYRFDLCFYSFELWDRFGITGLLPVLNGEVGVTKYSMMFNKAVTFSIENRYSATHPVHDFIRAFHAMRPAPVPLTVQFGRDPSAIQAQKRGMHQRPVVQVRFRAADKVDSNYVSKSLQQVGLSIVDFEKLEVTNGCEVEIYYVSS